MLVRPFALALPLALVLLATSTTLTVAAPTDTVVYSNDFAASWNSEWDPPFFHAVTPAPPGNPFYGTFTNFGGTLTVPGALPAHEFATVSFDLYIIDSWDGDGCGASCGPDTWTFSHDGGLDATTFSFCNTEEFGHSQSFPDTLGAGSYPCATGAVAKDSLGYTFYGDAVYPLTFTFPHDSTLLVVDVFGGGLSDSQDESWGIDNVQVTLHETAPGSPPPPTPELGSLALVGAGIVCIAACVIRRKA